VCACDPYAGTAALETYVHDPPHLQSWNAREWRLAVFVYLTAWFVLSWPWLSGKYTIPYDAKALFQAQLQFLANALHTGQSPFWNPSSFVGMPQIADPQSLIFSPAIVLAYFEKIPSFRELDIYVLAMLALGGLAVLKFCQDKGWHPAGAAVAAIAFAFGSSAAWRIQHISQIESLVFFAISLWLLARVLDRSSPAYGVLLGLAVGAMVVEPDQVALLACYVLAAYAAGHWLLSRDPKRALRASMAPLACAALVAVAIATIPLLVTYLFLEVSNRPEVTMGEAARGSLHPASLLTAVVADLFGVIDPNVDYWGPYSDAWDPNELTLPYNMSQMYLGTLPIVLLLVVGLGRGLLWAREIRVLAISTLFLILYALGAYTPAFAVFYAYLPGVGLFRRPVDATFMVGALLAIAAGYLVHRWATETLPSASYLRRSLEAGMLAAVMIAAMVVAYSAGKASLAWKPILVACLWIVATALVLAMPTMRLRGGGRFVVFLPAALLAADLAVNNGVNEATALPPSRFEVLSPDCRNETIRFLKAKLRREPGSPWRDRVELVGLGFEWQNASLVHGFEGTLGYNPFRLGEISDATGARDYIAGPDQKQFSALFPSYRSLLANLLGLRFIATSIPIEQIDTRLKPGDLKLAARTSDAYVYENPDALPRVLFVQDWKRVDFADLVESGDWPDFDPMRTVLLEDPPVPESGDAPAAEPQKSDVRIARYQNTAVEIEVNAQAAGFLVLHDVWHPWWTAKVDGEEVDIYRANVLFRAVLVPAGRHVVTFEFAPISGAFAELADRILEPPH
jgi:hypothetical protein